jgi:hypothetical protein
MKATKILLQIGACFCALIGALYAVITWRLLFPAPSVSGLRALFLVAYTLVAFGPFAVSVFPRVKVLTKSLFLGTAGVEMLIMGCFLWSLVTD